MDPLTLLAKNRRWAEDQLSRDPGFFSRLSSQQAPRFLWIGCSDSRVPATQIVDLEPGEMFVHRNIANVVPHADGNILSVLEFAVDVLKVRHIIVTGHYGCGGVRAALSGKTYGGIDNWLAHIKDVALANAKELDAIADMDARVDRLCELNVAHQVMNVARTSQVQNAWRRDQPLELHGWIYSLADGLIRDMGVSMSGPDTLPPLCRLTFAKAGQEGGQS